MDAARAHENFHVTLLRYYNPVGAHSSGFIGENPIGIPNNLMPYITRVASGSLQTLQVFGNDYDTLDGTGVKDYIHVVDLAKGHLAALHTLKEKINIYTLGTGKGISVLEMVETFKKVNGVDVPFKITQRRPGDIATSYADASKVYEMLHWKATHTIDDMVHDAWHYEQIKKEH